VNAPNTAADALKYLAVSTAIDTDIWQGPDSGKCGAAGGRVAGGRPTEATFPSRMVGDDVDLDYWHGE
jgi:hypothetical protein